MGAFFSLVTGLVVYALSPDRRTSPAILRRRSASNHAIREDPAVSKDQVGPRARHALAASGLGDVTTTTTVSFARPTNSHLNQAHRAHRSFSLGEIIVGEIHAVGAIARRALARHRQRQLARATCEALRQLDDHSLRDLGFDRGEITSVAAEVAGESEHTRVRAHLMSYTLL